MLAHTGFQLIKELKRSNPHKVSTYNEEKIRVCLEEIQTLYDANYRDVAFVTNSSDSSSLNDQANKVQCVLVRHAIMERNKRCLLAYHHSRLMQIKELRWQLGTILPKDMRQSMSDAEQAWFKAYCSCLVNFMQADASERGGAGSMDLTQSIIPPKSLFLEVRCLEDFGEFETENGSVLQLTKDSNHLMYRSDCEALIRQGVLEHLTS